MSSYEYGSGNYPHSAEIELQRDSDSIVYKFNESKILDEIEEYINSTYFGHYAKGDNKVQTTELIASDALRGLYFSLGNAIKYCDRHGHKDGFNRKDLLKAAHYIIMALDCQSKLKEKNNETK